MSRIVDPHLELAPGSPLEQGASEGDRDPVAQGVLGGAGLEPRRQPGQHRGVTESVPHAEQVEQAPVVADVDRAGVDHAQERDRAAILGEDRRTRQEELDLGLGGELAQLVVAQRVERGPRGQEARDLAQRRVQLDLLVDFSM